MPQSNNPNTPDPRFPSLPKPRKKPSNSTGPREEEKENLPPQETPLLHSISLTQEEVNILFFVLGYVGGPPAGTRGVITNIRTKLRPIMNSYGPYELDRTFPVSHGIYIDYPSPPTNETP